MSCPLRFSSQWPNCCATMLCCFTSSDLFYHRNLFDSTFPHRILILRFLASVFFPIFSMPLAATHRLSFQSAWYESMSCFRVSSRGVPNPCSLANVQQFSLKSECIWWLKHTIDLWVPYCWTICMLVLSTCVLVLLFSSYIVLRSALISVDYAALPYVRIEPLFLYKVWFFNRLSQIYLYNTRCIKSSVRTLRHYCWEGWLDSLMDFPSIALLYKFRSMVSMSLSSTQGMRT